MSDNEELQRAINATLQLERQLRAEKSQNAGAQAEINKLREEAKQFRVEIQRSITMKSDMENILRLEILQLREAAETAEKDAKDLRTGLEQVINSKNQVAEELKNELNVALVVRDNLKLENEQLRNEISSITQRLEQFQEHANILESKHSAFVDSVSDHLHELQRRCPRFEENVRHVRLEISKLEDVVHEFISNTGIEVQGFHF